MRIHLPAETWVEILEWLDYREFAKKMEHDALWDREFSPVVRDWLHEWHKDVKIGSLRFVSREVKGKNGDMVKQACLLNCQHWQRKVVPIAEVPVSRNIKSFNSICISFLDQKVVKFLHQMRPLLSQMHLAFDPSQVSGNCRYLYNDFQAVLELLLPTITGPLESLTIFHEMLRLFHDHFPTVLANAKMLIYRPQTYYGELNAWQIECLANWLFSPLHQGGGQQPRKLNIFHAKRKCLAKFVAEVRERFQAPNRLQQNCSFFVKLYADNVKDTSDENIATGEQLVVRKSGLYVLISCHSNNEEDKRRVAQLEQEFLNWNLYTKDRNIYVWKPEFGSEMEVKKAELKRNRKPIIRFGFGEEAGTSQEAGISSAKRKKLSNPKKEDD